MSVQMLTHIGLCVADLGRARAFYTDVLGFVEVGDLRISGATVDGTRLELIEAPGDPARIPQFPRPA